jgi:hypothetical protein
MKNNSKTSGSSVYYKWQKCWFCIAHCLLGNLISSL